MSFMSPPHRAMAFSEDMGYVEDPHRGMASAEPHLFTRALKKYPT